MQVRKRASRRVPVRSTPLVSLRTACEPITPASFRLKDPAPDPIRPLRQGRRKAAKRKHHPGLNHIAAFDADNDGVRIGDSFRPLGGPMLKRSLPIAAVMALSALSPVVHADANLDKAAITHRLQRWADAFNARDAKAACDLFAPDLISTVPDVLDGNRDAMCSRF